MFFFPSRCLCYARRANVVHDWPRGDVRFRVFDWGFRFFHLPLPVGLWWSSSRQCLAVGVAFGTPLRPCVVTIGAEESLHAIFSRQSYYEYESVMAHEWLNGETSIFNQPLSRCLKHRRLSFYWFLTEMMIHSEHFVFPYWSWRIVQFTKLPINLHFSHARSSKIPYIVSRQRSNALKITHILCTSRQPPLRLDAINLEECSSSFLLATARSSENISSNSIYNLWW